ncbi:MAG: sodium-dependent bicarbonate transport family permease, partial [Sphingobacteriia bacterium]
MNLDALLGNILHPPVLFFFLGVLAVVLKSDLEIPPAIAKFLSIYLLFDIGIKGGEELYHSGFNPDVATVMLACILVSFSIPFLVYRILRWKLNVPNAGAIAATYGSVSAVTFATGISFLESQHIHFGGYMVAGMALMESPAIISGLLLIRMSTTAKVAKPALVMAGGDALSNWAPARAEAPIEPPKPKANMKSILHEAFLNGSVLLLIGSLIIGYVSGKAGQEELKPFVGDIFKGMLSLYMLDMGLIAGKRLGSLRQNGAFLSGFALIFPIAIGLPGILLARLLGLDVGDALLFTILCASASYIAVPAAMRMAVPEANMSLLLPMSLGITFTFNITMGIP